MRINDYGFAEVGEWGLRQNLKSGVAFKLHRFEGERVIYAFVVEGEAKYIGVCEGSATTLSNRMSRYQNLQGSGQNKRIVEEIKTCLAQGKAIKIFALKPESSIQYEGLNIDLVRGLENPLINIIKPEWNIHN